MIQGFITDESLSVKENKELVDKANQEYNKLMEAYIQNQRDKDNEFENDIIDAIKCATILNKDAAKKIFDKAYEESHSYGYEAVINTCIELLEFVLDIFDVNQ